MLKTCIHMVQGDGSFSTFATATL